MNIKLPLINSENAEGMEKFLVVVVWKTEGGEGFDV
jgi:hypothetical protein